MKTIWITGLAALWLAAAPAAAPAQSGGADDIAQRIISVPAPARFTAIGARGEVRDDDAVQGGHALRVRVPGRSDQPWSVSVSVPIIRAVHAGDNLVLAFWARLEEGENGAATTVLPYNAVQMASAPYTAVFHGPLTIGLGPQHYPFWSGGRLKALRRVEFFANTTKNSVQISSTAADTSSSSRRISRSRNGCTLLFSSASTRSKVWWPSSSRSSSRSIYCSKAKRSMRGW